jgi:hypothetical protein
MKGLCFMCACVGAHTYTQTCHFRNNLRQPAIYTIKEPAICHPSQATMVRGRRIKITVHAVKQGLHVVLTLIGSAF